MPGGFLISRMIKRTSERCVKKISICSRKERVEKNEGNFHRSHNKKSRKGERMTSRGTLIEKKNQNSLQCGKKTSE